MSLRSNVAVRATMRAEHACSQGRRKARAIACGARDDISLTTASFGHIALDFLATLPQFQANVSFGTATELRYGAVVRKHQSPEPKR
ncbi:MAG TPA: hypothetical protein VJ724_11630, partial [Tahibacter sp.]|nr:hypothetical protein [Tahibacter sp.]